MKRKSDEEKKAKRDATMRRWYEANKAALLAKARERYHKNKVEIRARTEHDRDEYLRRHRIYNRRSRVKNIEKVKQRARTYYEKNKDRINAKSGAWARSNKAKRAVSRKKWIKKNPEYHYLWHMKTRYGLSPEAIKDLKARFGMACGICGSSRRLCVDHCHVTGSVRGLLCTTCNTAIGKLGDNVDGLLKAVAYLKAAEQQAAAA